MYRIPEVNRCWQEIQRKIVDQGDNLNLADIERLFDKAILAQADYSKQMTIKYARSKGPWGAWL